jgi:hypothetical protein
MSLVSQTLRALAIPFMFRRLDLAYLRYPMGKDRPYFRPSKWHLQRLDFFTSDRIRHFVCECIVRSRPRLSWADYRRDPDFTAFIMDKYLSRFPSLEVLEFDMIDFDERSLQALQNFPVLMSLTLSGECRIRLASPLSSPIHLQLRHISIQGPHSHSAEWGVIVNSDHLETLKISSGVLPPWLSSQPLPRLLILHLWQCSQPPGYPPLPEYPRLECLTYTPVLRSSLSPSLFSGLPKLKAFEGPPGVLLSLPSGWTVETLTIPLGGGTSEIPQALRRLAQSGSLLQSFHVSLAYLSHHLLDTICTYLLTLCDLEISVSAFPAALSTGSSIIRSREVGTLLFFIQRHATDGWPRSSYPNFSLWISLPSSNAFVFASRMTSAFLGIVTSESMENACRPG